MPARIVVRASHEGEPKRAVTLVWIFTISPNTPVLTKILVLTSALLSKSAMPVQAGDIIADGPSVDLGELALGQNMRIAFYALERLQL